LLDLNVIFGDAAARAHAPAREEDLTVVRG
jgi:hypothetical protein